MSLTKVQAVFGKYRLIAELGQGGMANVYLAVVSGPAGFSKLQVIKQLRSHLAETPEFLAMFLDEARLAARLNHPNVVQTNEVGEHDGQYFIAMEYLDGQPLDRVLRRAQPTGGLPLLSYIRILVDVLAGLHQAHELCDYDGTPLLVVHRDVTPHNVFITYDGQIKVVDFGIAKAANSSAETRTGVLKGKIAYMSPEQARGDDVDRRTDIFSVGLMLFEAITGERPWLGKNDIYVLNRLAREGVVKVKTVKPDVDPELEQIVDKALAFSREDRFATAAELQGVLERYLESRAARVSPRDIGRAVAEQFEDKRRDLKLVLDNFLRDMNASVASDVMIRLPSFEPTGSTPLSTPFSVGKSDELTPIPASESPSLATSPAIVTSNDRRPSEPAGARSAIPVALLATAGALLLVAGAITYLSSRSATTPPTGSATTPLSSTAASLPTPSAAASDDKPAPTLDVRIRAAAPDARIFLDGAAGAPSPLSMKVPRDGAPHVLRVEAPGFLPHVETVTYSAPIDLDVSLDPVPIDRGRGSQIGTPAPLPTQPGKRPRVTLDKDDPWAK